MRVLPSLKRWTSVLLLSWTTCVSLAAGVWMMASHLPFRADTTGLRKLAASGAGSQHAGWRAVHVLAADCPCSRRVADHLIERGPLPGLQESVVLVGTDDALRVRLQEAGLNVETVAADEAVARYRLHGAPWLVFVEPGGGIRYAGGYSANRDSRGGYQDAAVWEALRAGGMPAALPAYGCAVGRQLRRTLDPFGLKYGTAGT